MCCELEECEPVELCVCGYEKCKLHLMKFHIIFNVYERDYRNL